MNGAYVVCVRPSLSLRDKEGQSHTIIPSIMRQVTTDSRLPTAKRNAIVVAAGLPCQAMGCGNKATRWSNLCGLCERQFLEDMKPVFGKPSREQLAAAEVVVGDHFADKITNGVFDDWSAQIGRTFSRPLAMLPAPLALKRRQYP